MFPGYVSVSVSDLRSTLGVPWVAATLAGVGSAAVVLPWMASRGVSVAAGDVATTAAAEVYAVGGLFLSTAVPTYLLTRWSLVVPAGATAWFLGDTVYQELYGGHLHPLTSHLTVWPLLFGVALALGAVEVVVRISLDRAVGRAGLRPLV